MSVKRILMFDNEEDRKILQSKSMPVIIIDDEIKNLIQDMKDDSSPCQMRCFCSVLPYILC